MQDCLGRVPYASVIGFIMLFVGSGIMCGTLYEGTQRTMKLFEQRFYPIEEMKYVQLSGIGVAALVVFVGILVLTFSMLTTGATRGKIYRGDKCLMGGRYTAGFFIFISYTLNTLWVAIGCLQVVPVIAWIIFQRICKEESAYWESIDQSKDSAKFTYKLNLTHYGIYNSKYQGKETINDPNTFSQFCTQISTIGPLFFCSFGGTVFVILGLITLLGSLSSNMVRLKYTRELTEYRKAADEQHHDTQLRGYSAYPTVQETALYYPAPTSPTGYSTSQYAHGDTLDRGGARGVGGYPQGSTTGSVASYNQQYNPRAAAYQQQMYQQQGH